MISPEERSAHVTFAVQAHENVRARLGSLNQLSVLGLQSLILINGGAIVALFSLLGQGGNSAFVAKIYPLTLWFAFIGYGIGVSSAMGALLVGYWSQSQLNLAEQYEAARDRAIALDLLPPTDDELAYGLSHTNRGNGALEWAIKLALASLIAFCAGSFMALWATFGAISRATP